MNVNSRHAATSKSALNFGQSRFWGRSSRLDTLSQTWFRRRQCPAFRKLSAADAFSCSQFEACSPRVNDRSTSHVNIMHTFSVDTAPVCLAAAFLIVVHVVF